MSSFSQYLPSCFPLSCPLFLSFYSVPNLRSIILGSEPEQIDRLGIIYNAENWFTTIDRRRPITTNRRPTGARWPEEAISHMQSNRRWPTKKPLEASSGPSSVLPSLSVRLSVCVSVLKLSMCLSVCICFPLPICPFRSYVKSFVVQCWPWYRNCWVTTRRAVMKRSVRSTDPVASGYVSQMTAIMFFISDSCGFQPA